MEQISADIKAAMLSKDKEKLSVLRDIKSKLMLENTSGTGEVTDATAMKIVMKLHKQRTETYQLYMEQNREDLASEEKFQAEILETYLPKMMTEAEVAAEVTAAISQTGASGPQDMGKVMGILSGKLAGKADGKMIASLVKQQLS
ncbi:GatB/YqeY domain-containing protein [Crocinitomicaceae bacterium]|jgi:uncharacterized protein|nr:GatB/YqeY domain-containing protein [Crocinitomicaceae bacterium]MDG1346845.1 GatB/YqeY domain-containing protein [Crocinitomicaceae bacterium]MDG2465138.1 GatB/YqeY domain-containing protein [Crocinitomicaceae bacterium]